MIGEKFNPHNKEWVKQVGSCVVFSDSKLGELKLLGKLVYADNTTAVVKNTDAIIVTRAGHFSKKALEVYEELKYEELKKKTEEVPDPEEEEETEAVIEEDELEGDYEEDWIDEDFFVENHPLSWLLEDAEGEVEVI